MSSTQAAEMFQSSWMSWSSITIETETVESSQRMLGSSHDSRYRRVYSSKSATSSPGGSRMSRRLRMKARVSGETSSA